MKSIVERLKNLADLIRELNGQVMMLESTIERLKKVMEE